MRLCLIPGSWEWDAFICDLYAHLLLKVRMRVLHNLFHISFLYIETISAIRTVFH